MAIRPFLLPLGAALVGLLAPAGASGLLTANAAVVVRRKDEEGSVDWPILQPVREDISGALASHRSHRSHSSHRSHRSHSSHYSSSGSSYSPAYSPDYATAPNYATPPPPPPPKPGIVSLVAYPGGKIYVDGKLVGVDATRKVSLTPGTHFVRIENRFLGIKDISVVVNEGQTGVINVEW